MPRGLLAAIPLSFLALLALAPVLRLLAEGWAQGPALMSVWTDAFLRGRLLWSLAQAAITCVLALALGLPLAWVLAR